MRKILVLEDDQITRRIIEQAFAKEYSLKICTSLKQAKAAIDNEKFDLYILDRILPDGDGLELCKEIRRDDSLSNNPILFLSGCVNESEKLMGFFCGANDYVTKPFSVLELKARIEVHLKSLRRVLFTKHLEIDLDSFNVKTREAEPVYIKNLTPIEFKLLVFLLQNKEKVFSRTILLEKVWSNQLNVTDRVVDTHISHLRKKLSNCGLVFESYRGEGYKVLDVA